MSSSSKKARLQRKAENNNHDNSPGAVYLRKEEQISINLSQHNHNITITDLPSPEILSQYPQELQELIFKRINADIENDKELITLEKNEQQIRSQESIGEIKLKSRGQIFALLALIILSCLASWFGYLEAYKIAGAIVTTTVLGSITAFIGFGGNDKSTKK